MCLNLGRKEFGSETRTDIGNYNDYGCLNSFYGIQKEEILILACLKMEAIITRDELAFQQLKTENNRYHRLVNLINTCIHVFIDDLRQIFEFYETTSFLCL